MKPFSELVFKDDVRYTESHEWAKKSGGNIVTGVDDFSQSALGDIVYVELPEVGADVQAGSAYDPWSPRRRSAICSPPSPARWRRSTRPCPTRPTW